MTALLVHYSSHLSVLCVQERKQCVVRPWTQPSGIKPFSVIKPHQCGLIEYKKIMWSYLRFLSCKPLCKPCAQQVKLEYFRSFALFLTGVSDVFHMRRSSKITAIKCDQIFFLVVIVRLAFSGRIHVGTDRLPAGSVTVITTCLLLYLLTEFFCSSMLFVLEGCASL